jgi:chromosome segregation ATPase
MTETGPETQDADWYLGQGAPPADYDNDFEDEDNGQAGTGPAPATAPAAYPKPNGQGVSESVAMQQTAPWKLGSRPLQPENAHMWQDNTLQKINMAKALIRDAQFQTSKNELAGKNCTRRHEDKTARVGLQLKSKLMTSSDLTKALEDRINAIEDAIRHLGSCLFGMYRAYRSKKSQLNVCEQRLELRDRRPLQESVRDNLQAALENERQVLIEARQELLDHIEETKEMITQLEAMKQELNDDLQNKKHSYRIDRSCLHPDKNCDSKANKIMLPALPEITHYTLPPSPKDTGSNTGHQNEEVRCTATMGLIQRAVRLEEKVMGLIQLNDAAVRHCNAECKNANGAVCGCMDKSNHQTEHLKDQLMEQMKQVDATIAEAERSLARTKKKLDGHNQPLRCLNKQFALRDHRTDREHIRDPVTDNMEKHLEGVKISVKDLTAKWQDTKNILDMLKSSKAQMAEDLKHKNIALKIDDQCRKVTPKKAIEHDALDPCSGRVHPDGKKTVAGRLQAVVDREFG